MFRKGVRWNLHHPEWDWNWKQLIRREDFLTRKMLNKSEVISQLNWQSRQMSELVFYTQLYGIKIYSLFIIITWIRGDPCKPHSAALIVIDVFTFLSQIHTRRFILKRTPTTDKINWYTKFSPLKNGLIWISSWHQFCEI